MKHEAIYSLNSSIALIEESDDGSITCFDANGNVVDFDTSSSAYTDKVSEIESTMKLDELRAERDKLLSETDHYGLSDQTMSAAMTTYRQALRDITNTYSDLDTVVWPTKP